MRIAHVVTTPKGIGGAEKVVLAVVRAGCDAGWDQVVLNPYQIGDDSALASKLPPGTYRSANFARRTFVGARGWIQSQIDRFQPSVVQATLADASLLVATLRLECESILSHQHGSLFSERGQKVRAAIDRWSTRRFDHVVAVSDQVGQFLRDDYGVLPEKLVTIANGWEGLPRENCPLQEPTIVAVGHLRPEKGHRFLLEAFSKVVAELSSARLILIGDGPLAGELRSVAVGYGIDRHIRWLGTVEDIWPYLAEAHVFAMPSLAESSGIAAMEAMAAGLPIVASRVGGLPELIVNGESGILVPPGDSHLMAKALLELLTQSDLRQGFGRRGRELAANYTVDAMTERYLSLYESVGR